MAAKERPACTLTEGCIKYSGHEKSKHAAEAKCSTYEQAYPEDGAGPAEAMAKARTRKKAEREPLPADAAQWENRHTLRVIGAIERAWKQVPLGKRGLIRLLIAETLGQRDVEEVKS